jgi:hypothetical protein
MRPPILICALSIPRTGQAVWCTRVRYWLSRFRLICSGSDSDWFAWVPIRISIDELAGDEVAVYVRACTLIINQFSITSIDLLAMKWSLRNKIHTRPLVHWIDHYTLASFILSVGRSSRSNLFNFWLPIIYSIYQYISMVEYKFGGKTFCDTYLLIPFVEIIPCRIASNDM